MPLNLFNWKLSFVAELTYYFLGFLLHSFAIIAEVCFFLRNFLKSVACKMKTGIAFVTVENLIRVVVEAAEANFTVCLEKLFII